MQNLMDSMWDSGSEAPLPFLTGLPISRTGARFLELLGADELAFDNLYCIAFQLLDSKWISMRASYMEFNVILRNWCCFDPDDENFSPFSLFSFILWFAPLQEVLKSTRSQLEHELGLKNISRVEDLPSFCLLNG